MITGAIHLNIADMIIILNTHHDKLYNIVLYDIIHIIIVNIIISIIIVQSHDNIYIYIYIYIININIIYIMHIGNHHHII